MNRAAQLLREVATEADRRPIVRPSICGNQSCNRVHRADILEALARRQVTVAEAEAATLRRATAAVVDTQHHLAAEAITARPVTVVAEVAATVRPVGVTVEAIAAAGVVDALLEAEAAALLPAAGVTPLQEITAAITNNTYG